MTPDEILSPQKKPQRGPPDAVVVSPGEDFPWGVFALGVAAGVVGPKLVKGTTALALGALAAAWYATRS